MASYCVAEDVQVLLGYPSAYSTSTQPTLAQVNTIIEQVTAAIDMRLRMIGITAQPTDTGVLNYLKMVCASGSACRVGMTRFGNTTGVDGSQPAWYCKDFTDFMSMELDDLKNMVQGGASGNILSSAVLDGTYTESEITDNMISDSFNY